MVKKRRNSFSGSSRNVLWALLIVAAAVTVYGIAQAAVVSHTPAEITPQGPNSGLDSDKLWGLNSADILSAAGGAKPIYTTKCGWSYKPYMALGGNTVICGVQGGGISGTSSCTPASCASGDTQLATGCLTTAATPGFSSTNFFECPVYAGYCERVCRDD